MKYINLAGYVSDIDRVVEEYISKYYIQIEPVAKELTASPDLSAFAEKNPYAKLYSDAKRFAMTVSAYGGSRLKMDRERAEGVINRASEFLMSQDNNLSEHHKRLERITDTVNLLRRFGDLRFDVADLNVFSNIEYRFGRLPLNSFRQFETYMYGDSRILFVEGSRDEESVWGVYFAHKNQIKTVEATFLTLHFDTVVFPLEFEGARLSGPLPDIIKRLSRERDDLAEDIADAESWSLDELGISVKEMASAYNFARDMYYCYDCRKYAGRTLGDHFLFVGWMPEREAARLAKAAEFDDSVILTVENEESGFVSKPPTKLRNNPAARPFEFFVKMYGVPSYNELDPTPFVALSYSLFFGMMYGDVGQGLVLFLIGFWLSRRKKMALGGVMQVVGVFSAFFGLMYGSVFGFEDWLSPMWLNPREDTMELIKYTISCGVIIIIISMTYNIINCVRKRNLPKLLFDANGVSGMVFYVTAVACAALAMAAGITAPLWVLIAGVCAPLLLIAFKEPLTRALEAKKSRRAEELETAGKDGAEKKQNPAMSLFIILMELVEVLLGFFTNTLSFVRVGGFAVCHTGLMSVVLMLSGAERGTPNVLGIIIGNAFVMGLEGLVVGIQALRLEFYEMFSRYYDGTGKEFTAYKDLKNE
jgi:V/A-type H+-transporting ATPase subunit I